MSYWFFLGEIVPLPLTVLLVWHCSYECPWVTCSEMSKCYSCILFNNIIFTYNINPVAHSKPSLKRKGYGKQGINVKSLCKGCVTLDFKRYLSWQCHKKNCPCLAPIKPRTAPLLRTAKPIPLLVCLSILGFIYIYITSGDFFSHHLPSQHLVFYRAKWYFRILFQTLVG